MSPRRRHRASIGIGVIFSLLTLTTAGLGSVSAGCGWPSCNPAQLNNTYSKTIRPTTKDGVIRVHGQSSVSYPSAETWVIFSGSSYAKWLGSTPYNANNIQLTDRLHVDGLAVSVSIPSGFSGSGSDLYFTNSFNNTWQVNHSFSNVRFSCFACYGVGQDATASFTFGTRVYTISTHDDAFV